MQWEKEIQGVITWRLSVDIRCFSDTFQVLARYFPGTFQALYGCSIKASDTWRSSRIASTTSSAPDDASSALADHLLQGSVLTYLSAKLTLILLLSMLVLFLWNIPTFITILHQSSPHLTRPMVSSTQADAAEGSSLCFLLASLKHFTGDQIRMIYKQTVANRYHSNCKNISR